ncbi:MAG TPA: nucleoside phosphorylase [Acidimicrobiales bacterium]|nr:nucleoside phosphorylase [Acidimicrobiales bacterium]
MQLPLLEDDREEPGVIEAHMMHEDQPGVAPAAVLCFFNDVLDEFAAAGRLREVYTLRSEIGRNPVYEFTTPRGPVTVVHPGVGAPLAAGVVEEVAALGVRTFVACGGAGALVDDLALGHVMVVTSALRDEGTSLHYAAPSRIIEADPLGVSALEAALSDADVPFFLGRTWTTDALFRETRSRVQRRTNEGCSMVDMESSAFIAVARYRGLRFAQLLYAGDSLAGDTWDSRHWDRAGSVREELFEVAATAALALHNAVT